MPISSLVITYRNEIEAESSYNLFSKDARIELGKRIGLRQPVVIETATQDDDKELWKWLNTLPAITHVDVVFISLVDDECPTPITQQTQRIPHSQEVN